MTLTGVLKRIIDNNGEPEPPPIPKPAAKRNWFESSTQEEAFKAAFASYAGLKDQTLHARIEENDDGKPIMAVQPSDFIKFRAHLEAKGLMSDPWLTEQIRIVEKVATRDQGKDKTLSEAFFRFDSW